MGRKDTASGTHALAALVAGCSQEVHTERHGAYHCGVVAQSWAAALVLAEGQQLADAQVVALLVGNLPEVVPQALDRSVHWLVGACLHT